MIFHFFGVSGGPAALLGEKNFEFFGVCFLGVSQPVHHFGDKTAGCDFSFFFGVSGGPAALLGKFFSNFWEYVF